MQLLRSIRIQRHISRISCQILIISLTADHRPIVPTQLNIRHIELLAAGTRHFRQLVTEHRVCRYTACKCELCVTKLISRRHEFFRKYRRDCVLKAGGKRIYISFNTLLFVPLAEAGRIRRGDVVIETVAREYLTPLKNAGVDTLILGCTHYPLLTDVIGDVMGPGVELVSAGEESAFELKRMLKARELRADQRRRGAKEVYVSAREEDYQRPASLFLQEDLRHTARRIDIERY